MSGTEEPVDMSAAAVRRRAALTNAKTSNRWTAAKEDMFFEELATTCNISHAAAQVGMHVRSAYHRKYHVPAFAARWAEALEAGYTELETLLLRHAIEGSERVVTVTGPDGDVRQVKRTHSHNHALASRLLGRHAAAMERYRAMMALREGADDEQMVAKIRAELARVGRRLRDARENGARVGREQIIDATPTDD